MLMRVQTMRKIDYFVGIPLCFLASIVQRVLLLHPHVLSLITGAPCEREEAAAFTEHVAHERCGNVELVENGSDGREEQSCSVPLDPHTPGSLLAGPQP